MKNMNESGRSMVEMLGVLAIVGVLSIGGIAGYTRAMKNWRVNEIIDAANKVAAMVETDLVTHTMTYNQATGDMTNTTAGTGPVHKIAGGVVSQITAYGAASATKPNTVEVTLESGNTDIADALKEKLNCTTGTCYIGKNITLTVS